MNQSNENRPTRDTGYRHRPRTNPWAARTKAIIIPPFVNTTDLIILLSVPEPVRRSMHVAFVTLWKDLRAIALASQMPAEPYTLEGSSGPVSTPKQLAEWCNNLAARIHVNRTNPKAPGYIAPCTEADFHYILAKAKGA